MNKVLWQTFVVVVVVVVFVYENYQVLYILLLLPLLLPHFAGLTRMCLVDLGERSVKFSCADDDAAAAGWVSY